MAGLAAERRGIEPVPPEARTATVPGLFAIWYGAGFGLLPIGVGTVAAAQFVGLGWWDGLAAIAIGTVIAAAVVGALAARGAAAGVPQLAAGRGLFGRLVSLPALVAWASLAAWAAAYAVLGSEAVVQLFGGGLSPWVGLLVMGLLEAIIAWLGYRFLARFQGVVAVVQTIVFVIITVALAGKVDLGAGDAITASPATFALMVAIAAGLILLWALAAADYTRYVATTATRGGVFVATFLGLAVPAIWLEALGLAIAGTMLPATDPVMAFATLLGGGALGALGAFGVGVGVLSVNGLLLYSASLSALATGLRVARSIVALVTALLVLVVAAVLLGEQAQGWLENVLLVVGYWVAAWAAVVLAARVTGSGDAVRTAATASWRSLPWGLRGLVAVLLGAVAGVIFMDQALFIGPGSGALDGADVGYLAAFVVGAAAILVLDRVRIAAKPAAPAPADAPPAPPLIEPAPAGPEA